MSRSLADSPTTESPAAESPAAASCVAEYVIVGGGAAGLMTAIMAARAGCSRRIVILDGAASLGAKILIAGGGRCNVTNARVSSADYRGGNRRLIQRVLAEFTVAQTVTFFREIGVALHEEAPCGKLFPNTNRARTVLNALLTEADRLGVAIQTGCRVSAVTRAAEGGFILETTHGPRRAAAVVLATGGRSLPKTGSDGLGYELARSLGHRLVETTPALEPLLLSGELHRGLSGVSHAAALTIAAPGATPGAKPATFVGPLLWTHFGLSGPVALDASGWWRRARLEGSEPRVILNLLPAHTPETLAEQLRVAAVQHPRSTLGGLLSTWLPARIVNAVLRGRVDPGVTLAHLTKLQRRTAAETLTRWPVPVVGGRGYGYAEVTAGGVPLEEVDLRTMQSRVCEGLYLVGEILDVDGRIGGFNFQWAWSSGFVAGRGLARHAAASAAATPAAPTLRRPPSPPTTRRTT